MYASIVHCTNKASGTLYYVSTEPIWTRPAPGQRKPAHTREAIVATAMRIADAEGFEAVSMRRIAAELGAGTMTLYHYVRTKDELIVLMADAIMGEMLVPEAEMPDGWRDGLAAIARRTRGIFLRRPWVLDHMDEDGPVGPNMLRHIEQSLAAVAGLDLPVEERFELIGLVDDYVIGYSLRARFERPPDDRVLEYIDQQLRSGDFPHVAAFAGDDVRDAFGRLDRLDDDEQRFERGLQTLLDGIEQRLAQAP